MEHINRAINQLPKEMLAKIKLWKDIAIIPYKEKKGNSAA